MSGKNQLTRTWVRHQVPSENENDCSRPSIDARLVSQVGCPGRHGNPAAARQSIAVRLEPTPSCYRLLRSGAISPPPRFRTTDFLKTGKPGLWEGEPPAEHSHAGTSS